MVILGANFDDGPNGILFWILIVSPIDYSCLLIFLPSQNPSPSPRNFRSLSHVFSSIRRDLNFIDHPVTMDGRIGKSSLLILVVVLLVMFAMGCTKPTISEILRNCGAAFARQFKNDDPVLNMVDEKILKRGRNRPIPGAWLILRQRSLKSPLLTSSTTGIRNRISANEDAGLHIRVFNTRYFKAGWKREWK
ncbi:hypothetical protein FEM48_Zijuj10G0130000 [Ziziphus jujuba var. spinosa]|uniref:Uncharacterized protein n=1 Tax=Ziziphus jujuba var. spinosa TaxID=714518 RepID=A0A978UNI8_ZIZJJ|nr:hypothetical protein FEM48_Zijuj10G0130000 [Ziziphus jujuba var. spinosa]